MKGFTIGVPNFLQLGEKKYVIKGEGTKQINYHCLSPVRVRLKSSS